MSPLLLMVQKVKSIITILNLLTEKQIVANYVNTKQKGTIFLKGSFFKSAGDIVLQTNIAKI